MTTDTSPRAAFSGQGTTGRPVAIRLLSAGRDLAVHDIDPAAMRPLLDAGARGESSSQDAARASLVITMLPNGQHVLDVTTGQDGVLAAASHGFQGEAGRPGHGGDLDGGRGGELPALPCPRGRPAVALRREHGRERRARPAAGVRGARPVRTTTGAEERAGHGRDRWHGGAPHAGAAVLRGQRHHPCPPPAPALRGQPAILPKRCAAGASGSSP